MLEPIQNRRLYSREEIENQINTNKKWLYRAILAIYKRQTLDEKVAERTKYTNNIGFNSCDAKILSSFAKQLEGYGSLSIKQIFLARKKMKKYCGQLTKIANGLIWSFKRNTIYNFLMFWL